MAGEGDGAWTPEAEQALADLGLAGTEIRTYRYLIASHGATPTAVARDTGQSRGRIYETLRVLVAKGLAREEPSRPVRYLPVPLSEVLAVQWAEARRRVEALRSLRAAVGAPVAAERPLVRPQDVTVYMGRRAAAELGRLAQRARERLLLVAGGRAAERLVADGVLLDQIQSAARRGIDVEVHVAAAPGGRAWAVLESALGGRRVRPLAPGAAHPLMYVVADATCLLTVVQPDDASPDVGDDVTVRLRGGPFVEIALQDARLYAPPANAEVASTVPAVEVAVTDLDPQRVGMRYLQALAGAHQEVLALGPPGWGRFLERGWEATVGVYASAKLRGVRFRALTAERTPRGAERFGAVWETRVVPWVPAWVVLVDGRELFQAFTLGAATGAPQVRHSTEPGEVRFYLDLFERLWGSGQPVAEEPTVVGA
jgi:sugar-specific transcriptional regulator TrmB